MGRHPFNNVHIGLHPFAHDPEVGRGKIVKFLYKQLPGIPESVRIHHLPHVGGRRIRMSFCILAPGGDLRGSNHPASPLASQAIDLGHAAGDNDVC